MSDVIDKILAAKLKMRRELADLPFDQKLDLMEKIRERNEMLAENPLHYRARENKAVAAVSGNVAKRKTPAKRFARRGAGAAEKNQ